MSGIVELRMRQLECRAAGRYILVWLSRARSPRSAVHTLAAIILAVRSRESREAPLRR
jgi:hypothetical protein